MIEPLFDDNFEYVGIVNVHNLAVYISDLAEML